MISGSASGSGERTCTKCTRAPSISVRNWSNELSRASRAPVVVVAPVRHELAQVPELGAVVPARVGELLGEPRARQPFVEIVERGVGNVDAKRLDAQRHVCRDKKPSRTGLRPS